MAGRASRAVAVAVGIWAAVVAVETAERAHCNNLQTSVVLELLASEHAHEGEACLVMGWDSARVGAGRGWWW